MQKNKNKKKKKHRKQKTNQNKIKTNRMSMNLLGGIWLVIRLSPLKPKIRNIIIIINLVLFLWNGRLKFT